MLIAFCALMFQSARNEFYRNQPLPEIEIQIEKLPLPGSFDWDLEHQCGHMRNLFPLQNYIDCLTVVEEDHKIMWRKDI